MAKNDFAPKTNEEREFKKVLESIDPSKHKYSVFCDWLLCSALAFAQVSHFDDGREKRYLETINKYSEADRMKFAELLAITTNAFTMGNDTDFHDFLGNIYMVCGFGSSAQGQFFTPYSVCRAMAQMIFKPEKNKIMKILDPAIGGGALPIAYAEEMYRKDINYQQWAYFEGWDVSENSCCMAMIQMSLLGMPATIVHGNSLSLKVYDVWETPMVGMSLIKERMKNQETLTIENPLPKIIGQLDLFTEYA